MKKIIGICVFLLCFLVSGCTYIVLPNAYMSPVGYDKEVKTKVKVPLVK